MLRSVNEILGYVLDGLDEEIGKCKDFLFDDRHWAIRYLVADTGRWLPGKKVLVSPISLDEPNWKTKRIPVKLTKEQIENCPSLSEEQPVSREFETKLFDYYGYPYYWAGNYLWGVSAYPSSLMKTGPKQKEVVDIPESLEENHLRSVEEVKGYNIRAVDEGIGHVEDFIVEESTWAFRYIVVDTRNWLPGGKKVIISPDWITAVKWFETQVEVNVSKEQIENSPEYDPASPINREYEIRLYDFYGRPYYW